MTSSLVQAESAASRMRAPPHRMARARGKDWPIDRFPCPLIFETNGQA
jgi:hypothetical protein